MYQALKELYILRLNNLYVEHDNEIYDKRTRLTKENVGSFFKIKKSFWSTKYTLKQEFIYISRAGNYYKEYNEKPFDEYFSTYYINKSLLEEIEKRYNNKSRQFIKEFKNDIWGSLQISYTFEEARDLLCHRDLIRYEED